MNTSIINGHANAKVIADMAYVMDVQFGREYYLVNRGLN